MDYVTLLLLSFLAGATFIYQTKPVSANQTETYTALYTSCLLRCLF